MSLYDREPYYTWVTQPPVKPANHITVSHSNAGYWTLVVALRETLF